MTTLTPANTPATAIDLGRLGDLGGFTFNVVSAGPTFFGTDVVKGSVSTASPFNAVWYKFNITSLSSSVAAQHMWVNAVFDATNFDAILHDPSGTAILDEWPDADGDPDIRNPQPNEEQNSLVDGTYYIQVQNTGSPTNYEFGLVAAPDPNYFNQNYHIPLGAGSTEATAKNLGTLTSGNTQTFQDAFETLYTRTISNGVVTVNSTKPIIDNRTDFFEFTLPASGNLTVGTTGSNAVLNAILHVPAQGSLDVPHSELVTNGQSIHLVQGGPYYLELDAANISVTGGGTNPVEARLPSENFQLYSLSLKFNQDTTTSGGGLTPTPPPGGSPTTTPTPAPSGGGAGAGGAGPQTPEISLLDTTSGQGVSVTPSAYSGPVAGLQHQYIYPGTDNVNVTVIDDNWFLKGGPGEDALQAHGGYNVLDGSTGSNFLTGGSGTDTFFVDDRNPPSDIWSTVNSFHEGDDATVFGIVNSPAIQWFDNDGAPGYTGLTLHVFGQNAPTASLTLVGYSSADLSNGRLTVQFGNEADGTAFMHIIGTG